MYSYLKLYVHVVAFEVLVCSYMCMLHLNIALDMY